MVRFLCGDCVTVKPLICHFKRNLLDFKSRLFSIPFLLTLPSYFSALKGIYSVFRTPLYSYTCAYVGFGWCGFGYKVGSALTECVNIV